MDLPHIKTEQFIHVMDYKFPFFYLILMLVIQSLNTKHYTHNASILARILNRHTFHSLLFNRAHRKLLIQSFNLQASPENFVIWY